MATNVEKNSIIDLDSKIPLYHQLKEKIKTDILNGRLKEGDLIDSERELSDKFNLSSTTVRRALNDLVQENLLERKAGKGTFVRIRRVKRDLRKVLSFTNNMIEMGFAPSSKVLSKKIVNAGAFARESLKLKKGAKVVMLKRLRFANDMPMMLETRFVNLDMCPDIMDHELSGSMWKIYTNHYGCKPMRHSQTLGISKIEARPAALLGVDENAVVYIIKGVTYAEDGRAIECEESFYRSDKYELSFEAITE